MIYIIGYGGWFFGVQAIWRNFDSSHCLHGWDILDFTNLVMVMWVTVTYALVLAFCAFGFLCCILCCPCLVVTLVRGVTTNY
jgi:hypothetical protein